MKGKPILIRDVPEEAAANFKKICTQQGHSQQWVLRNFVINYGKSEKETEGIPTK